MLHHVALAVSLKPIPCEPHNADSSYRSLTFQSHAVFERRTSGDHSTSCMRKQQRHKNPLWKRSDIEQRITLFYIGSSQLTGGTFYREGNRRRGYHSA